MHYRSERLCLEEADVSITSGFCRQDLWDYRIPHIHSYFYDRDHRSCIVNKAFEKKKRRREAHLKYYHFGY